VHRWLDNEYKPTKGVSNLWLAHIHTQPFYDSLCTLSQTIWASRYQQKHSPMLTPIVVINHPYLLPPPNTIHGIISIQITCLVVAALFHNLSLSFLWSTSWPGLLYFILHTFLRLIILLFSQNMPIPLQPLLLSYQDCVV